MIKVMQALGAPSRRPYFVTALLLSFAGFISLTYVFAQVVNPWGAQHDTGTWQGVLAQLFNMDVENNVPTWYSAVLWLICSYLACKAAFRSAHLHAKLTPYWWLVAVVAGVLSMDEVASIHELVGSQLGAWVISLFAPGSTFDYSWLIAGMIFASLVLMALAPFVLLLPRRTAAVLLLGGAVFMLGAVGVEGFTAAIHAEAVNVKPGDRLWTIIIAAEESLEMLGVIIAIHATMLFLRDHPRKARAAELGEAPAELA